MAPEHAGNVLLVASGSQPSGTGGRALLSAVLREALAKSLGDRLLVDELEKPAIRGWRARLRALSGWIDGVDADSAARIVATIRSRDVRTVFIDGSNLGTLAAAIRSQCPAVRILTFFHNCEARFFLGALRHDPSVHACGVLLANCLAERRAVRCSDQRICLSERDSSTLRKLHGKRATDLLPMAMRDRLPAAADPVAAEAGEDYALFVGGAFYANLAGIAWYARNVAPRIPIRTCVVGHGVDRRKQEIERHGNIHVVGAVDDLAPWYLGARFVVAPIFDGSGMKTKVAEALMFGKRVIGTPEAFSGYEDVAGSVGTLCRNAADFERAVRRELGRERTPFDRGLRGLYEERYSMEAATARLARILGIEG